MSFLRSCWLHYSCHLWRKRQRWPHLSKVCSSSLIWWFWLAKVCVLFNLLTRVSFNCDPGHRHAKFPQQSAPHSLNALNEETQFEYRDRYLTTKLLDIVITRQLAENQMFKNGNVVLCSLTPGLCRSDLMRNASPLGRWCAIWFM